MRRTRAARCRDSLPADAVRATAWRPRPASAKGRRKRARNESARVATPQAVRPASQVGEEARWPAEIEVALSRHTARSCEGLRVQVTCRVVVPAPSRRPHRVGCTRCDCAREQAFREVAAPLSRRNGTCRCVRRAATRPPESSQLAARACSMASTGVAPIPALSSTTGPSTRLQGEAASRLADIEDVASFERRRSGNFPPRHVGSILTLTR